MKSIVAAFIIGIISGYYVAGLSDAEVAWSPEMDTTEQSVVSEEPSVTQDENVDTMKTVIDEDRGISFIYRKNPDGYVLTPLKRFEGGSGDEPQFEYGYRLMLSEDAGVNGAGEAPPSIDVLVFKNPERLAPKVWATTYAAVSNIELLRGEVVATAFKDADAVRYMSDGLHATDTVLAATQNRIYILRGSFVEEDSLIRDDFLELIDGVEFIGVR
jgi:hypothetical protein